MGGWEAGPSLSGSTAGPEAVPAGTPPLVGTVKEDTGNTKPKLPTFLRQGALTEDATAPRDLRMCP